MTDLVEDFDGAPFPAIWQPQLQMILEMEDDEAAVYSAIGAATSCWDNLEGAGVFQSERAKAIGIALCLRLGIH